MCRARRRWPRRRPGFPIAKIAAKLAVGYTLDEIQQRHHRAQTPASFEPSIDYVVTKIPRWAFEKLPGTPGILGTQMQSVGEVMAIGRTFPESLQKGAALARAGSPRARLRPGRGASSTPLDDDALAAPWSPCPRPIASSRSGELLRRGVSIERVHDACRIDPWFLDQMLQIVEERAALARRRASTAMTRRALAPRQAARVRRRASSRTCGTSTSSTCARRATAAGVLPTYKTVDTCAAEFAAETPYHYCTYEDENEVAPSTGPRSSSSAAVRTASGRASSSTTAACTPRSPSATPGTRR